MRVMIGSIKQNSSFEIGKGHYGFAMSFITGMMMFVIVPFTKFPSLIFITGMIRSTRVITVSITGVMETVMAL